MVQLGEPTLKAGNFILNVAKLLILQEHHALLMELHVNDARGKAILLISVLFDSQQMN